MLQLVRLHPIPTVYETDVAAEATGHSVLRLPIAHCELNPIELIWAQVKEYAARQNKKFTMAEALKLSHEGIETVTPDKWAACVKHVVEKVEPHFWEKDHMCEEAVEEFIIRTGSNSSDDDTGSDED